jgi:iron complex transport system substrate-binding protein
MGRVAAALAAAALLATGCGERAEPTGAVELDQPRGIKAQDRAMAELIDALRATGGEGPVVVLAWSSDPEGATVVERRKPGDRGLVAPADTIEQVMASIGRIGLLVGRPLEARRLVEQIERQRERVRARVAGRPPVGVFVDVGFFATAGDRTLIGDLLREAGGENVAGPTPEPGPFPLRQLREADPDVYLYTSDSKTTREILRANEQASRLRAVREGRVVEIPSELLQPGARIGEGLEALARALHPDASR